MVTTTTRRATQRRTTGRLAALVAAGLVMGACSSSGGARGESGTASVGSTAAVGMERPATTAASGGATTGRVPSSATTAAASGVIPRSSTTMAAASATTMAAASATTAAAAAATGAARSAGEAAASDSAAAVGAGAKAAAAPATTRPGRAPQDAPLRAGSVDDNARFGEYLGYRSDAQQSGVPYRELDPTGRMIVRVVGSDGLPAAGRTVRIGQGRTTVAELTATADGSVRFLPRAWPGDPSQPYTASVAGSSVVIGVGGDVTLRLAGPAATPGSAPLDVLFLLDTTGSMGDEIGRLKATIGTVAERLAALPSQPDLRLGMTIYRDLGDEYVTRTSDFTRDVGAFTADLARVRAANGGDVPEAVDEALAAALDEPSWRPGATSLVFLVADAGPHTERQVATPYPDSLRRAAQRGIKVFPVASSNTDDRAEFAFRQMAQATGARFVFLSYGAGGAPEGDAALGAHTDIDRADYAELALDDLVVRLVSEELAALTTRR